MQWFLKQVFLKILQISVENTCVFKKRLQHKCFLVKFLRTPCSREQLQWLLFKTRNRNDLFQDVSAISLTHNQSLIICNSHNDKFHAEIPRRKFVEITLIFKDESTWKLWRRFSVKILTRIRLSKSTKHRWVLRMGFSMSYRRQIDVTSVLPISIVSCPNIFRSGNLFKAILV